MFPIAILASCLLAAAPDYEGTTKALATELVAKQFDKAMTRFEPGVAKMLPAKVLGEQWQAMVGNLGAFKHLGPVKLDEGPRGKVAFIDCVYEKGSLRLMAVLNEKLQVVGLRPVPAQSPAAFEAAAREVVAGLAAGSYEKVLARFSPVMRQALPAEKLASAWNGLVADAGAFGKVVGARLEPDQQYGIVEVECAHARKNSIVRVVLDGQLKVDGLFFKPAWNPPDYADTASFDERPVTAGTRALPLPGTLSLPRGKGPFPAVVLVHGSGPNDADESYGPNKIFKDLAWGLASRKVAVLRYTKRTAEYRGKLSNADITSVKVETEEDAHAAVALLAKTPGVDPKRIFVAGHSLGALLAPRIAADDDAVHGVVLLAGPTRLQWHLVVEQLKYLASLEKQSTPALVRAIGAAEENARKLDAPGLSPSDTVDGIPGSYWLDLRAYQAAKALQKLGRPALVLQGERDYQVTMKDFEGWKAALAGQKTATLKTYPSLNHHFMPGTGPSSPAEYQRPNHVPRELVDDLAAWVLAH
ncbi:MAG: alpha/beta hydrolase [Myxococcaceae bacterium]